MNWFRFATLAVLWLFLVFFLISILTGTFFVSQRTTITEPSEIVDKLPEDAYGEKGFQIAKPIQALDQIKTYLKSGGTSLAVILIVGFFIAPTLSILSIFALTYVPMTNTTRYKLVFRLHRMARMTIGPIVVVFQQLMYAKFKVRVVKELDVPNVPYHPEVTFVALLGTQLEDGLMYQCFVYLFCLASIKIIKNENKIDPPTRRSRLRLVTLAISWVCMCCFYVMPHFLVYMEGAFEELLESPVQLTCYWTYDSLTQLSHMPGYNSYCFYFWFWLVFMWILPFCSLTFQLAYQLFPEKEYTAWLGKHFKQFYLFEVYVVSLAMRVLGAKPQDAYFRTHNLKNFCERRGSLAEDCFHTRRILYMGYWFLVASVIFYYVDDIYNVILGFYRQAHEEESEAEEIHWSKKSTVGFAPDPETFEPYAALIDQPGDPEEPEPLNSDF